MNSKAAFRHSVYACIFHIGVHFQGAYLGCGNQHENFQNATQCGKCMCKWNVYKYLKLVKKYYSCTRGSFICILNLPYPTSLEQSCVKSVEILCFKAQSSLYLYLLRNVLQHLGQCKSGANVIKVLLSRM